MTSPFEAPSPRQVLDASAQEVRELHKLRLPDLDEACTAKGWGLILQTVREEFAEFEIRALCALADQQELRPCALSWISRDNDKISRHHRSAAFVVGDYLRVEILPRRPLYDHDCPHCEYLGSMPRQASPLIESQDDPSLTVDLYACTSHGGIYTMVVRYGNDRSSLVSGFSQENGPVDGEVEPHLIEAIGRLSQLREQMPLG